MKEMGREFMFSFLRRFGVALMLSGGSMVASAQPCWDAVTGSHFLVPPVGSTSGFGAGANSSEQPNYYVDGNVAVVGDHEADNFTGRVVVYTFDGQSWNQVQILTPDNYSWFGRELDMDGSTLVVSAELENVPGSDPQMTDGLVYVYEWDGQSFQLQSKLQPPSDDGVNGWLSRFGALRISGDWIMAGKSDEQNGYNNLYVFKRTNQSWNLVQTFSDVSPSDLKLDGPFAGWGFNGDCIQLQGNTWVEQPNGCLPGPGESGVAIDVNGFANRYIDGQWQLDAFQPGTGSLIFPDMRIHVPSSIFREIHAFDGQSWSQTPMTYLTGNAFNAGRSKGRWAMTYVGTSLIEMIDLMQPIPSLPVLPTGTLIDNPMPDEYDFFGCSVAVGHDYAAIGIRGESPAQTPSGSAMIFKRDGASWLEDGVLMVPVQGFSYLGDSIDITGTGEETILVIGGAGYCAPQGNITNPGQAFVASRNSNAQSGWQLEELVPNDPVECNPDPNLVWDGYSMSVEAAGSGDEAIIAVGYAGKNSGGGVVEIFKKVNGIWQNVSSIAESLTPGTLSGSRMDLLELESGTFLLIVSNEAGDRAIKFRSQDAGVTWSPYGPPSWVNYNYGRLFKCVFDGEDPIMITASQVIRVNWGPNDEVLLDFDTGLNSIDDIDSALGDDGVITSVFGSNTNSSSPVKVMQFRPLENMQQCARTIPVDLSGLSIEQGLGTQVSIAIADDLPVVLAGAPNTNLQNGNATLEFTGRAIMTFPPPPFSPPSPFDVDGDEQVGIVEMLRMLDEWGPCSGRCQMDYDGDDRVSVDDLLILMRNWTF
tara:strand:- start:3606 stop:6050 length:2445 start_codon:yes stop_codon:yes gene_type:complete